jgi:hypothetical protein
MSRRTLSASDATQPFAFLIFFKADPLCIARWSVLSLLMRYCGYELHEDD